MSKSKLVDKVQKEDKMVLTLQKLAGMMECGALEAYDDKKGILELCESSKKHGFGVAFTNSGYLPLVVKELKNTKTRPGIAIAFPCGFASPEVKVFEAKRALEEGAQEFDMVMNIQRFRSEDYDFVLEDIRGVVETVGGFTTKVIIETCYLTKPEIVKASQIVKHAGAQYVKTSTGNGRYSARLVDIQLIKENVDIGIKASADIEDLYTCLAMIKAGATLIGIRPGDAENILDQFRREYKEKLEI